MSQKCSPSIFPYLSPSDTDNTLLCILTRSHPMLGVFSSPPELDDGRTEGANPLVGPSPGCPGHHLADAPVWVDQHPTSHHCLPQFKPPCPCAGQWLSSRDCCPVQEERQEVLGCEHLTSPLKGGREVPRRECSCSEGLLLAKQAVLCVPPACLPLQQPLTLRAWEAT